MSIAFPQDNPLLPTGRLSQSWQRFFQSINSQVQDVVAYTPTVGATSGTLGSAIAFARYQQIGKQVVWSGNVQVTDNGTGAGALAVDLPSRAFWTPHMSVGSGFIAGGSSLQVAMGDPFFIPPSISLFASVVVTNLDGSYPLTGATMKLSIVFELP